jgi:beta-lactam-binding protein with PASTA domain
MVRRVTLAFALLTCTLTAPAIADRSDDAVVPDLMKMTHDQAVAAAKKAGFDEPFFTPPGTAATNDDYNDIEDCVNGTHVGTVCAQDPAPGTHAARDAEIKVIIGEDSKEKLIVMPDLRGMTMAQATAALAKVGYKSHIGSTYSEACTKPGIICGQLFPPGQKVRLWRTQAVDIGH